MSDTPNIVWKVLTAPQMADWLDRGAFAGAPVDLADGYIHLSALAQLDGTVTKHFAGQSDLFLAAVDLAAVEAAHPGAVKWEVSRGGALFPHVYADLPLSAMRAHASLTRDAAGTLVLPAI
ncbi:MAG TPA: DUF952 domain-containing protein [Novosphingobium sp.]|nr:DUF952 domain-containing protein [Novosphingobium sp.]